MGDAPELPADPDAGDDEAPEAPPGAPARRRRLDRRTIAICVAIAVLGALVAGLVTSMVVGGSNGSGSGSNADGGRLTLSNAKAVNIDRMMSARLVTQDGKATSLDAIFGDKPLLVNLWAHNCTPCVREMPMLDAAAKANPQVQVIGIATQDPVAKAQKLATQTKISYDWVLDPDGDFFYEVKAAGLPTTLLIAPDGAILKTKTGAFTDEAQLQAFIDGPGG